jgi:serine/threonine protein kinase
VYEVWDRERKAQLALKALHKGDADALYRFKKEFRQLADLSHPNLVALYELLNEDNRWYYTMELVPGASLAEALKRDPEEDPAIWIARVRKVFASLGEGLLYLHEQGRLHGDLKPSNVLVCPQGRPALTSASCATSGRTRAAGRRRSGHTGVHVPEQARVDRHRGERLVPAG